MRTIHEAQGIPIHLDFPFSVIASVIGASFLLVAMIQDRDLDNYPISLYRHKGTEAQRHRGAKKISVFVVPFGGIEKTFI